MKRLIPFVFTTLAVLLSIVLVNAYRSGLLAKIAEGDWRERLGRQVTDVPESD